MKLQSLHIKNFKFIVDLKIVEPNPFTVFVGRPSAYYFLNKLTTIAPNPPQEA